MRKILMATAIVTCLMMSSGAAYAQSAKIPDLKLEELRRQSIQHFFKFYDANEDEVVSKDEFMTAMEKRFDEMDMDTDGIVTGDEVFAHHSAMQAKMMKERDAVRQKSDEASPLKK